MVKVKNSNVNFVLNCPEADKSYKNLSIYNAHDTLFIKALKDAKESVKDKCLNIFNQLSSYKKPGCDISNKSVDPSKKVGKELFKESNSLEKFKVDLPKYLENSKKCSINIQTQDVEYNVNSLLFCFEDRMHQVISTIDKNINDRYFDESKFLEEINGYHGLKNRVFDISKTSTNIVSFLFNGYTSYYLVLNDVPCDQPTGLEIDFSIL